ncbi:MAG: hypothetical protein ACJ72D_27220, partial [Marmoricola sp.]
GSAGYVRGGLTGVSGPRPTSPSRPSTRGCRPPAAGRAEVAYLGVGQLGLQDQDYIETYWAETVRAVGARRAVLTHWDDFFGPLPMHAGDAPLRALPYAGDDLDVTLDVLTRLAAADDVALSFPTLWEREDPWAR